MEAMEAMDAQEGVIKFQFSHNRTLLRDERLLELARELMSWRAILKSLEMIGQLPGFYNDAGFGNVSARFSPFSGERGKRRFLITGTQTGGLSCTASEQYCLIEEYDTRRNTVRSHGLIEPSSESMTHGTIYDLDPRIRFVFHGHSRIIWPFARQLQLPCTQASVPYGTPAMADEVRRLFRQSNLPDLQVFAMLGHEDGIVAYGSTALEAGSILLHWLARAYQLQAAVDGKVCN